MDDQIGTINAKTDADREREATANNIGWSYGLTMTRGEVEAMIRGLYTGLAGQAHLDNPMSAMLKNADAYTLWTAR